MNWDAIRFDWNHARAFLATARLGSFSAAARALDLTQPTLGRQVAALEGELGVTLFERVGRQLELTDAGRTLAERAEAMGDAAIALSISASSTSQAVSGRVTISVSDIFAAHFLPEILARLQDEAPQIVIEIHASNELADLQRREADIAIRHVRPDQPDLIARLVHESPVLLYAATDYLDRMGRAERIEDLARYDYVSMGDPDMMVRELNKLGIPAQRRNLRIISSNGMIGWQFVRQGLGVVPIIPELAQGVDGIECILPDFSPITVPFWLTVHRELHTSRRIRLVYDVLGEMLSSLKGAQRD